MSTDPGGQWESLEGATCWVLGALGELRGGPQVGGQLRASLGLWE